MTTRTEFLRKGWARSDRILRRVYNEFGPKHVSRKKLRPFPTAKFAVMTRKQVDQWDFSGRHLMHQVAKVLERQ